MPIKDSVINTKMTGKIFFKPMLFMSVYRAPPVSVDVQNYQKDEGLPLYALLEKAI